MDDYLASCKARGPKKRQGSGQYASRDPLIKFLRQRTSRLNYGTKVDGYGVRPELATDRLIDRYNSWRFGASLRNEQFADHFAGKATYYFWADHKAGTPEALFMIDIDAGAAHGGGSTEGCWRFAEQVKKKLFPGMYLEASTNGEGVHGYIVLCKAGIKTTLVRAILKNLDAYLKRLAASVKADIACVEVKGLPPRVQYDDNGNISHITFGQFAKLPRGRGVLDTCKVKYGDLALLDPDEIKVEPEPRPEKTVQVRAGNKRPGSFDCRVVRQETLDRLPELERLASSLLRQWTGADSFKAGRWTVTATDVAQFFAPHAVHQAEAR